MLFKMYSIIRCFIDHCRPCVRAFEYRDVTILILLYSVSESLLLKDPLIFGVARVGVWPGARSNDWIFPLSFYLRDCIIAIFDFLESCSLTVARHLNGIGYPLTFGPFSQLLFRLDKNHGHPGFEAACRLIQILKAYLVGVEHSWLPALLNMVHGVQLQHYRLLGLTNWMKKTSWRSRLAARRPPPFLYRLNAGLILFPSVHFAAMQKYNSYFHQELKQNLILLD